MKMHIIIILRLIIMSIVPEVVQITMLKLPLQKARLTCV